MKGALKWTVAEMIKKTRTEANMTQEDMEQNLGFQDKQFPVGKSERRFARSSNVDRYL